MTVKIIRCFVLGILRGELWDKLSQSPPHGKEPRGGAVRRPLVFYLSVRKEA